MKCHEHGLFTASFKSIKKGSEVCFKCMNKARTKKRSHSYEYVKNYIETKTPYTIISKKYNGNKRKLELKCKKHGIFSIIFNSLQRNNSGCKKCANTSISENNTYLYDKVKMYIEKNTKYKLISRKYKSSKIKMTLSCGKHGHFKIRFNDIQQKHGCLKCSFEQTESKGERECRKVFEKMTGKKFDNINLEFMINPETGKKLQLDGYCKELNMAFEYDGRQHYEPIDFFGGVRGLQKTQKRDSIKNELCKNNDIVLIRIPHWTKNIEEYILKETNRRYYNEW